MSRPEQEGPGTAVPGPSVVELDLGKLDLSVELAAASAERHHQLLCGDREVADLLGAWIDALLDEWNRRRG
ncbi:hypothetical protein SAMN05216553_101802 [Lentzea fradiae]|uniref:Uncharacterized protein n=1 Tax=Lentzea fradiae TaxID=200378 RepID=A0A1G7LDT5_9PSEU|nr:hypothetical protein [Lentzea fradiae]SDF47474.1 hypothetical protein SAMN05216553_101802 [Lentzea fradiae]